MIKPSLTALVGAAAGLAAAGCDQAAPLAPDAAALELHRAGIHRAAASLSDVIVLANGQTAGKSVLRRSAGGVATELRTTKLEPGFAYTGWWFVFDAPQHCSPPACSEDDIFAVLEGGPNPHELTILGPIDGNVADPAGRAALGGPLAKGDVSSLLIGDGLDHPLTAEVWIIIRSHGAAIPGGLEEQLGSVDGGCHEGDPNEGQCMDVQVSVHQP